MTPDQIAQLQALTAEWAANGKRATELLIERNRVALELQTIENRQHAIQAEAKDLVFPSVLDQQEEQA